jgi:hypothetical protein
MKKIYLNKYKFKKDVYIALFIIELIIISNILFISTFVINNDDDSDSAFNQSSNDYTLNKDLNYLKSLKETILNGLIIVNKKFFAISSIKNDISKIVFLKNINLVLYRAPPLPQL